MTEFAHDPFVQRPEPDREILIRARNYRLRTETEMEKWIRQQWEAAFGATRVALDAVRKLWPSEAIDNFDHDGRVELSELAHCLEQVYLSLDRLAPLVQGPELHQASIGILTKGLMDMIEREEEGYAPGED